MNWNGFQENSIEIILHLICNFFHFPNMRYHTVWAKCGSKLICSSRTNESQHLSVLCMRSLSLRLSKLQSNVFQTQSNWTEMACLLINCSKEFRDITAISRELFHFIVVDWLWFMIQTANGFVSPLNMERWCFVNVASTDKFRCILPYIYKCAWYSSSVEYHEENVDKVLSL